MIDNPGAQRLELASMSIFGPQLDGRDMSHVPQPEVADAVLWPSARGSLTFRI